MSIYNVRKLLSPSSSVLLLAKTITHPAARSLCDSWASCFHSLPIQFSFCYSLTKTSFLLSTEMASRKHLQSCNQVY